MRKLAKEEFYGGKNPMKLSNVDVNNIVISKLVILKYLIGYLDTVIRSLIFILPKISGYVKNFKYCR